MKIPNSATGATQTSRHLVSIIAAIVLIVGIFAWLKLQPPPRLHTEQDSPGVVFGGNDTSISDRQQMASSVEDFAQFQLGLNPDTWLTLFRFDSSVKELYCGKLPDSDEDLLRILIPNLKPISDHDDTYLEKLFGEIAKRTRDCRGNYVVIVATSGFMEGMTLAQHKSLTASAKILAKGKKCKAVFFIGTKPANIATLRRDLAPLGKRVQFPPKGMPDSGLINSLLSENQEAVR